MQRLPTRRAWLQWSVKSLAGLLALLGVVFARIGEHRRQRAVLDQIRRSRGRTWHRSPLGLLSALLEGPLSGVVGVDFSGSRALRLELLKEMPGLVELDLHATDVTDLRPVRALENLECLDVSGVDADLTPIAELTTLKRLHIGLTEVSPSDFSFLRGLVQLRHLFVENVVTSDLGWLERLTSLEELILVLLPSSNLADLHPLRSLTNLRSLAVVGSSVADLSPLTELTRLRNLYLCVSSQLVDLTPLSQLPRLEVLDVMASPVFDLSPLRRLSRLQEVSLLQTPVEDLGSLAALADLRVLDIRATRVADLTPLGELSRLQEIHLCTNNAVPERHLGLASLDSHEKDEPKGN